MYEQHHSSVVVEMPTDHLQVFKDIDIYSETYEPEFVGVSYSTKIRTCVSTRIVECDNEYVFNRTKFGIHLVTDRPPTPLMISTIGQDIAGKDKLLLVEHATYRTFTLDAINKFLRKTYERN